MVDCLVCFHEKRGRFPEDLGILKGVVCERKNRTLSINNRAYSHRNIIIFTHAYWIAAEGIEAESLIESLFEQGVQPAQIYLISPFAHVAARLKIIGRKHGIYTEQRRNAGTVHTTQGKQAKIVI